jgi:hypothetical protein
MVVENPWAVDEAAWPEAGTAGEKLAFAVRYAILAPSPLHPPRTTRSRGGSGGGPIAST